MTPPRLLATVGLLLGITLFLAACGSGAAGTTTTRPTAPAIEAKGNAVCRGFLGEVKELGEGALANPPAGTTLQLTTERLVRPSLPLIRRTADRLQRLEPQADSEAFDLYANLFDPFIVLTEKRLKAGIEGDYSRARGLEEQLTDLSLVQRRAAQLAGLSACDVDFPQILLQSLSE
jgi:hypothetical protein